MNLMYLNCRLKWICTIVSAEGIILRYTGKPEMGSFILSPGPSNNFSMPTHVDRSCIFGGLYSCFSVRNCKPAIYLSVTGFCKKSILVFLDY